MFNNSYIESIGFSSANVLAQTERAWSYAAESINSFASQIFTFSSGLALLEIDWLYDFAPISPFDTSNISENFALDVKNYFLESLAVLKENKRIYLDPAQPLFCLSMALLSYYKYLQARRAINEIKENPDPQIQETQKEKLEEQYRNLALSRLGFLALPNLFFSKPADNVWNSCVTIFNRMIQNVYLLRPAVRQMSSLPHEACFQLCDVYSLRPVREFSYFSYEASFQVAANTVCSIATAALISRQLEVSSTDDPFINWVLIAGLYSSSLQNVVSIYRTCEFAQKKLLQKL
ncbi:MAG: hypothetical protein Q8L98_01485 [Chlamydiales bacterium]|nr:hypothetical protein [Chlamydiales bacterium]